MLYFDHAATTQPLPQVLDTFEQVATRYYANPSSAHPLGQAANQLLQQARQQIAEILHFSAQEVFFTSSGTESNNWALQGVLKAVSKVHPDRLQVILSAVEHPSINQQAHVLEEMGFEVKWLPVDLNGQIDLESLSNLLSDQVLMLSTMAVNNEVGTIQPLKQIAAALHKYPQIVWHVDGVQAVTCQLQLLQHARIDLLTLSGHKFHAVRGVGILAIRQRVSKQPLLYGGGQEGGLRSSTENLPAIVATAKALRLTAEKQAATSQKLISFQGQIYQQLEQSAWKIIGQERALKAPNIICGIYAGIPGEVLLNAFADQQVMVSTTSACSSRKANSHTTLSAMGIADNLAGSAIRFSMSQTTEQDQVDRLLKVIDQVSETFCHDLKGV